MSETIGITTTVPIEILMAAGYQPADLNNILVTEPLPERLLSIAEQDGFPLNCCSWIKGIYGACQVYHIDNILCVTTGDCSNTNMLAEILQYNGKKVITFAFPQAPDEVLMEHTLLKLCRETGTTLTEAEKIRRQLSEGRKLLQELDYSTWHEDRVSGWDNHLWQVSSSDFNRNYDEFVSGLKSVLAAARTRKPYPNNWLRLAYIGVPSVFAADLYPYLENNDARVVFNEIQRQFAMPQEATSLARQYTGYTYPYSTEERLKDIRHALQQRKIDGVIHYVQAFCHRGIADILFRNQLDVPVLTLEGNDNFFLNEHAKTRIEAFLDMLLKQRRHQKLINSNID